MLGLIKYPVITDKATRLLEMNKYTFMVDKRANKFTIKKVIEYAFNVKVLKINTMMSPIKNRTVGRFMGHPSQYKSNYNFKRWRYDKLISRYVKPIIS